jgi:chorismate mutase
MMSSSAPFDLPPSPAPEAEEPPPQDGWPEGLTALRRQLDQIDNALHQLLMRRARVVEGVAKSGKRHAYRPGREASIIRRLLRCHRGALPPQTLVRIWRELLAGTIAMQEPFAVAVCEPDAGSSFTQAAREHFGVLTPLHSYSSPAQAMAAVSRGAAAVAVLPLPSNTDTAQSAWWIRLLQQRDEPCLHVVGRLPFWAPRPAGAPSAQAFVIAAIDPDPSGRDRSLLAVELDPDVSGTRLTAAITSAQLTPGWTIVRRDQGTAPANALAEIDDFLTDDDPRLARLDPILRRRVVLGAYAVPEGTA